MAAPWKRRSEACRFRPGDDAGQATLLGLAALGLAGVMLLALGPMGRALADRAQARTAADAAALAGAARGEPAAREVAAANGAEVIAYRTEEGEVVVEVEVGGVGAFSRARRSTVPGTAAGGLGVAGGTGARAGLAGAMLRALERADRLLGRAVPVASGHRSTEQQQALWDRRHVNPFPVAPPGSSFHERGLAVDVPSSFVGRLLTVAEDAGLCQPLPATDPVHFELCGIR